MSNLFEVLIIVFLFSLFGFFHSFLAGFQIKRKFCKRFGNKIAFYRLGYNIISFVLFVIIFEVTPHPDAVVYDLPFPFDFIILGLQYLSIGGIIWSISVVELNEFIGTSQIKRYMNGAYDCETLDEKSTFYIKGPFRFVRHPIYLFSILFLGLRPTMDLFYLTFYVCIVAYFVIGSYYEEEKLKETFGTVYEKYQESVPRIVPYKFVSREKLNKIFEN